MSSQPQLYEFVKEDHPALFERIRDRIKEGRWEAEGAMWVEADTNVPSGESLVRQILFGKRFFREEFGVECRILWLPDVFGYSAALPQILKKSGVDYFMTAKLWNNEINRFPYDTFLWRGIDGTEILTHLMSYAPNAYNTEVRNADIGEAWDNYRQKEINDDILLSFGYGDGGGGPTREMLETIRRLQDGIPGCPRVRIGTTRAYFEKLEERVKGNKRLPKWVGELYYELHRGTYTSMARNKRLNRRSEILYVDAEWAASMVSLLLCSEYPREQLNRGWKGILLNQFHDVLPGSSIKEVYQDTDEIYGKLGTVGRRILSESLDDLCASIELTGESLIVFNSLSWDREGLVGFHFGIEGESPRLRFGESCTMPCQPVAGCLGDWIAWVEGIPSKGYRVLSIERGAPREENLAARFDGRTIENRFFRLVLESDGSFSSLYDKTAGRETLPVGTRGNRLQAFEDKPRREDNWNLDIFYSEKEYPVDSPESVEVLETGPVRTVLRLMRRFVSSIIIQDIVLYDRIARIDFRTHIDWKEKDIVLKAAFPVEANTARATFEVQYGHIERSSHWNTSWDEARFEVCGHKWADVSEDGYGVSLLNDCKYGYDVKDGCMRLTLLRSGTTPNPDADREAHDFCYSIYPHTGSWQEAGTVRQAYDLNVPFHAKISGPHPGKLAHSYSLVSVDCDHVVIEVIKQAEDGSDFVVRLYESFNRRGPVELRFCRKLSRLVECDLMERETAEAGVWFEGETACFEILPLEIKTFRFDFKEDKGSSER